MTLPWSLLLLSNRESLGGCFTKGTHISCIVTVSVQSGTCVHNLRNEGRFHVDSSFLKLHIVSFKSNLTNELWIFMQILVIEFFYWLNIIACAILWIFYIFILYIISNFAWLYKNLQFISNWYVKKSSFTYISFSDWKSHPRRNCFLGIIARI